MALELRIEEVASRYWG